MGYMIIKAITLWEPWATLVALGLKGFETRSWATDHRGLLAIHSATRWQNDQKQLLWREPFASQLGKHGITRADQLQRGKVLAIHNLAGCRPAGLLAGKLSATELAFGDFSQGRWAWDLRDQPLRLLGHDQLQPVKARGRQRLWAWEVPWEVAAHLEGALGTREGV